MMSASYVLCEAVSDLTSLFMSEPQLPVNSRDTCALVIDWAEEFDRKHAETDWAEVEYLELIDRFFAEKYRAWLEATPARLLRENR